MSFAKTGVVVAVLKDVNEVLFTFLYFSSGVDNVRYWSSHQ